MRIYDETFTDMHVIRISLAAIYRDGEPRDSRAILAGFSRDPRAIRNNRS